MGSCPRIDNGKQGKGVLLGAYIWGPNAYEFTAMSPQMRVQKAVEYGAQIHPALVYCSTLDSSSLKYQCALLTHHPTGA